MPGRYYEWRLDILRNAAVSQEGPQLEILPPSRPAGRLPSLDGFRAISIALVIIAHATGTAGLGVTFSHWRIAGLGSLGVNIFFVISGYLITHMLLQELDTSGRISLRDFYLRRMLRICPAFYVFVAVMVLASCVGLISIKPVDIAIALTYTVNLVGETSWYVGHLWSLSLEAQFYLVWPLTLFLLGRRRAVGALSTLLVVLPLIRLGSCLFLQTRQSLVRVVSQEGIDALTTGCLVACIGCWLETRERYTRFLQSPAVLLAPACVVLTQVIDPSLPLISVTLGQAIKNLGIAICIDHCVRYPQDTAGRILNSRIFVFVGALSYSLYLWQQPFLNRQVNSLITSFPLSLAIVVLVAASSYYLVEKPFLKLRRLFRRVQGPEPNTKDKAWRVESSSVTR